MKQVKKAVVVHTDGKVTVEDISTLDKMQAIVGGRIELVQIDLDGEVYDIFLNEEGKLLGLPTSAVLGFNGGHDLLCGNLIISKSNEEGEQISLSDEEIEDVKFHIGVFNKLGIMPIFMA